MPQWRPAPALERNALPIFLVLLTLGLAVAYHGVLHYPFIFDDITSIPRNSSLNGFATALHPPVDTTVSGRPLLNLSFALNRALWGDSLTAYHLGNIAILWVSAALLFGLIRRTLIQMGGEWATGSGIVAGMAALLWAVHPLQTESVTYIVQRAESLMALCYLAVLYGLARSAAAATRSRPAIGWGIFCVLACYLGMAAKEVMVSAPVVALAYDRLFFARSWQEALRRRWPIYGAMAASWLLLGLLVASTHGRSGTAGFDLKFAWPQFLRTEAYAIMRYLRLSFVPSGQILDYGTYWIDSPLRWVPAAIGVIALGIATSVAVFRNQPVGWLGLWFFAVLAPTCLIPVTRQTLAEHRMYLALAPVAIGVVVALTRFGGGRALVALAAGAAVLVAVCERRNRIYVSDYSIWHDVTTKLPTNGYDQNNVGHALFSMHRYDEAESYVRKALEIDSGYAEAWVNLGVVQDTTGRGQDAEISYRHAIALNPRSSPAHNNYSNLLRATGRLAEARKEVELAIAISPDYSEAHNDYGNVLIDLGQVAAAEQQYRLALQLDSSNDQAHNGLGSALLKQHRLEEARAEFALAKRVNPGLASAYANDGEALEQLGRRPEALAAYLEAEARDPKSGDIRYNHGNIVFRSGDYLGAIALYSAAIRLNPNLAVAHYNLAVALYHIGKIAEAGEEFSATVRLDPNNAGAHNNYGAVLLALGRPAEALAQFEIVAKLSPQMAGLAGNLAAAQKALPHRP